MAEGWMGDEVAPDVVGTVEGWRVWRILVNDVTGRPALTSVVWGHEWTPGQPFKAYHAPTIKTTERHPAPMSGCCCGIHASMNMDDQSFQAFGYMMSTAALVLGRVAMWGRMIVHETGYRAEFAAPAALVCRRKEPQLIALSRIYGVPLEYEPDLPEFADFSEMLSWKDHRILKRRAHG